jgi:hypothetical protein
MAIRDLQASLPGMDGTFGGSVEEEGRSKESAKELMEELKDRVEKWELDAPGGVIAIVWGVRQITHWLKG